MKQLIQKSFGPIVSDDADGNLRAACVMGRIMCSFLIGDSCTFRGERKIENRTETPDWCEMRDERINDALKTIEDSAIPHASREIDAHEP